MTNSNLKRSPQYVNALESVRSGRTRRFNLESEAPDKSDVYVEPTTLEGGEPTSYGTEDTQVTETVTAKEAKDMQKELEDGMEDDPQYVNTTLNSDRRVQRDRGVYRKHSRNPQDNSRLVSRHYSSNARKISNQNQDIYMKRQTQRPVTQEFNDRNYDNEARGVRSYPDNARTRMHSQRNPINRNYTKREILEYQREGNDRIRTYSDGRRNLQRDSGRLHMYSKNERRHDNNDSRYGKERIRTYNERPSNHISDNRNDLEFQRSRKFSGLESREAKSRRYSAHKPITFIPNDIKTKRYSENPTLKKFDNSELADLKYQLGYEKGLNRGLNQLVSKYSKILDGDSVDSQISNGSEVEKKKLHMRDNDYSYTNRNPIIKEYMEEIMDENVDMMEEEGEFDMDGNFMPYEDRGDMDVYSNRGRRYNHTKSYSNNRRNENHNAHTKSYSNNGGNEDNKFTESVNELL